MEKIRLEAKNRDLKNNLQNLRKSGLIPAVLYGHNIQNQNLSVKKTEFEKVLKKAGESTIIELITNNGKTHPVLIHDVQLHYLTNEPIHTDFYQVSMTEKLKTYVSLEFAGDAPAVKVLGGVLVKVLSEVEVQCLPADLPRNIPVTITKLKDFQSAIYVKDLKVSDKVNILTSSEEIIAKVQPPRNIETEKAAESAADAEKAAVEAVVTASEKLKTEDAEKIEDNKD